MWLAWNRLIIVTMRRLLLPGPQSFAAGSSQGLSWCQEPFSSLSSALTEEPIKRAFIIQGLNTLLNKVQEDHHRRCQFYFHIYSLQPAYKSYLDYIFCCCHFNVAYIQKHTCKCKSNMGFHNIFLALYILSPQVRFGYIKPRPKYKVRRV